MVGSAAGATGAPGFDGATSKQLASLSPGAHAAPNRLSSLWAPACAALGRALEAQPEVAWPLVHGALQAAQAGFLDGSDRGAPALNM